MVKRDPNTAQVFRIALFLLLVSMPAAPTALLAQEATPPADAPLQPIERGAWLYDANCTRCHEAYDEARLGDGYAAKELQDKITGSDRDGCEVDWAISRGGPLALGDIQAIVTWISAWEEQGSAPAIAALPPPPTFTPRPTATPATGSETPTPAATPTPVDPAILAIIEGDEVAHGAWLYSIRCVPCHGAYARARQGSTLNADEVKKAVTEGKMGTNMPAFGRIGGGDLRIAQINAVVTYISAWEAAGAPPVLPELIQEQLTAREALFVPSPTPTLAPVSVTQDADAATVGLIGLEHLRLYSLLLGLGSVALLGFGAFAAFCAWVVPPRRDTKL